MFEFAALWKASNYQLTLTGSYMRDRQEYPGFWRCVFESLAFDDWAEKEVENTVKLLGEGHGG